MSGHSLKAFQDLSLVLFAAASDDRIAEVITDVVEECRKQAR